MGEVLLETCEVRSKLGCVLSFEGTVRPPGRFAENQNEHHNCDGPPITTLYMPI